MRSADATDLPFASRCVDSCTSSEISISAPPSTVVQHPVASSKAVLPADNVVKTFVKPANGDEPITMLPPVLDPWDILISPKFDVIKNHSKLLELSDNVEIQHWGPNCATYSRARERNIPGARVQPLPLRSVEYPEGLPRVFDPEHPDFSAKTMERVKNDTFMAQLAAKCCLKAHRSGRAFTLEHPGRSRALDDVFWKELLAEPNVYAVYHHHCMFADCNKKKFEVLITNIPHIRPRLERVCEGNAACSRTLTAHASLAPAVVQGYIRSYGTTDTAEYPSELCSEQALAYLEYTRQKGSVDSKFWFLEVFAGRNAPLTKAVRRLASAQGQYSRLLTNAGIDTEASSPVVLSSGAGRELRALPRRPSAYQLADLAAGRQPKWTSSIQLIPDGIEDPERHIELARQVQHPHLNEPQPSEGVLEAIHQVTVLGLEACHRRIQVVEKYETLASELESERIRVKTLDGGYTFKQMDSPIHVPLLEQAQVETAVADQMLARKLLLGLPIVGEADRSPYFSECHIPADISVEELLKTSPERRSRITYQIMASARAESAKGNNALLHAVSEKTLKEVAEKKMGPGLTEAEMTLKRGHLWNVAQRYGILQGTKSDGKPKYRCIDNHADNMTNAAAVRLQTVPMQNVSMIMLMVRALDAAIPDHRRNDPLWKILGGTEDMQAAYRQCPLLSSQVCVAITAVFHPNVGVRYHEMWGQPFGAGHAVPNFCRIAEHLARIIRKLLFIVTDHFFDDFWIIEPKLTIDSAFWSFNKMMKLLGFSFDKEKEQLPRSVWQALGVVFDMQTLQSSRLLIVKAKPSRLLKVAKLIIKTIKDDSLTPNGAAKLFGQLDFLNTTLFGRVGRSGLAFLKARELCTKYSGENKFKG